jgi:flagellar motor switch protein FliM
MPTTTDTPATNITPPASRGADTVSQSEIEQLLAQVESASPSLVTAGVTPPSVGSILRGSPQRHTFPKLSLFSPAELRPLRMRHEDYITALAARVSIHLGLEVSMQLSKLEVMPYLTFIEGLSSPTYLSMVKLAPLAGMALLDMPPKLALCIVDRELGGPGKAPEEPCQIGKMETRLLNPFISVVVNEWAAVWRDLMEIRPTIIGSECNSRYANTSTAETSILAIGIQTTLGPTVEQIQLAFPHPMLEPLTTKLTAAAHQEEKAQAKPVPAKWSSLLDTMQIEVTAQLPGIELSAGEVANLKVGDVVTFPPEHVNLAEVLLAGHPAFVGTLGVINQRRAVRIEKRLKA